MKFNKLVNVVTLNQPWFSLEKVHLGFVPLKCHHSTVMSSLISSCVAQQHQKTSSVILWTIFKQQLHAACFVTYTIIRIKAYASSSTNLFQLLDFAVNIFIVFMLNQQTGWCTATHQYSLAQCRKCYCPLSTVHHQIAKLCLEKIMKLCF